MKKVKHILNGKLKAVSFDKSRHNKKIVRKTLRTGLVLLMLKGRAGRLGKAEWVILSTMGIA